MWVEQQTAINNKLELLTRIHLEDVNPVGS